MNGVCDHVWTSWVRGRRRGYWFRICQRCGASERSETAPENADTRKPLKFDTDPISDRFEDFKRAIFRRMTKFTVEGAREGVRQERRKVLDWRMRRAGGE